MKVQAGRMEERERIVLVLWNAGVPMTKIAKMLDLSPERVRQLRNRSLRRIREDAREFLEDGYVPRDDDEELVSWVAGYLFEKVLREPWHQSYRAPYIRSFYRTIARHIIKLYGKVPPMEFSREAERRRRERRRLL